MLARGTFIGSLVLALVGAVIAIVTEPSQLVVIVGLSVAVVIYGGVGMLMASKHRSNPLGWLFCGIGATLGSLVFALAYANIGSPGGMGAGTAPASDAASWFVLIVPPAVLGFSLPAARARPRRWAAARLLRDGRGARGLHGRPPLDARSAGALGLVAARAALPRLGPVDGRGLPHALPRWATPLPSMEGGHRTRRSCERLLDPRYRRQLRAGPSIPRAGLDRSDPLRPWFRRRGARCHRCRLSGRFGKPGRALSSGRG